MTDRQVKLRVKKMEKISGAFGRKYNHPLEGAFDLIGHVIKQAINDYRILSKKKKLTGDENYYLNDARHFLFDGALENLVEKYQLSLDCDAVRDQVRKAKICKM